jgi:Protein of unknown function (DUF1064)
MNKYHAKPTIIENIRFHSAKEAKRYVELLWLQRAGEISNLQLQPKYDLIVNNVRCGVYIADFRYRDADGQEHVEDTKGVRTSVYALKKRIVEALYNIRIEET